MLQRRRTYSGTCFDLFLVISCLEQSAFLFSSQYRGVLDVLLSTIVYTPRLRLTIIFLLNPHTPDLSKPAFPTPHSPPY
jgi:hypothetical protein